jgi:hypothetical protein
MILATTAAIAVAFGPSQQLLAQGANAQAGASTSQNRSAGPARTSGNTAARAPSTTGQASGGRGENGVGAKSEKIETSARIGSKSNATTVREYSRTRVGVYSGGRDDFILHRRHPHGMIVYNDELSSRIIVRHHRPHGFVMYNDELRRRVVLKERHPGVAISERTTTRAGEEIKARTGERSRETTGSASKISPNQGSTATTSRQSSSSQVSGGASGNAGKQPSTTGQGAH